MQHWSMETRLLDACLALGRICTVEAKWAEDPALRAALLGHALGFLDAAWLFLPSCGSGGLVRAEATAEPVAGIACSLTKDKGVDTHGGS